MSDDRAEPLRDPMEPFYETFDYGSDKSKAVSLPVTLENLLEQLLRSHMRPDPKTLGEMFRPSGSLGSFGARVKMAYVLGYLDHSVQRDFLTIGKIRNAFAHRIEIKTFEHSEVKTLIDSLHAKTIFQQIADTTPGDKFEAVLKQFIYFRAVTPEEIYRETIRLYCMILLHVISIKRQEPLPPGWVPPSSSP